MAYASWLADVLSDAGLTVKPYSGWETRGISDFAPRGVMLHHTVTKPSTSDAVVDRLLAITGSSKVSAPLCQYSTNRDGSVSVIAAGTANHGGIGRWNGVSGNRYWFGDEMKNLGTAATEPWAPLQVECALRAAAAILTHIGADETWLCGHKEYATPPGRKVDPHTLNMSAQRALVRDLLEEASMSFSKGLTETQWRHLYQLGIAQGVSEQAVVDYWMDPKRTDEQHDKVSASLFTAVASKPSGGTGAHTHPEYITDITVKR